jgi:succinate dehydrogenase hydrophobic anchor subunit
MSVERKTSRWLSQTIVAAILLWFLIPLIYLLVTVQFKHSASKVMQRALNQRFPNHKVSCGF